MGRAGGEVEDLLRALSGPYLLAQPGGAVPTGPRRVLHAPRALRHGFEPRFSRTVALHESLESMSGAASVVAQHLVNQLARSGDKGTVRKLGGRLHKEQAAARQAIL